MKLGIKELKSEQLSSTNENSRKCQKVRFSYPLCEENKDLVCKVNDGGMYMYTYIEVCRIGM